MTLRQHAENIRTIANLLEGKPHNDDAYTHAQAALIGLESTVETFDKQQIIKREAAERVQRVRANLGHIWDDLAALSGLLTEGVGNAKRIKATGEQAVSEVEQAGQKIGEAKALAEEVDGNGQYGVLNPVLKVNSTLFPLTPLVPHTTEKAERQRAHFVAAGQNRDDLAALLAPAKDMVATLAERITTIGEPSELEAKVAESGQPQLSIRATDQLLLDISISALNLRNSAERLSSQS